MPLQTGLALLYLFGEVQSLFSQMLLLVGIMNSSPTPMTIGPNLPPAQDVDEQ